MTRTAKLWRSKALLLAALVTLGAAAAGLVAGCGDEDRPVVEPTTLLPSPSASPSASPAASTSPDADGGGSGGGNGTSPTPGPSATARITDKSIRFNIEARIRQDPSLRTVDVRVRVRDRNVTLTGRVRSKDQKHAVEQIAVTEPGVRKVVSYLEVVGGGTY